MTTTYALCTPLSTNYLNVDMGEATLIPSQVNFCGSYFLKEDVAASVTNGMPTGYDYFYLRTARGSQPYLGALWGGGGATADATTLFTLAAVAATTDGALICATAVAGGATDPTQSSAPQGLSAETLFVFIAGDDPAPKAICGASAHPYRVYKTPETCIGAGNLCPLTWQECTAEGYCFDKALQGKTRPKTIDSNPSGALWFPNCTSRALLSLVVVGESKVGSCTTPPIVNGANEEATVKAQAEAKVFRKATWAVAGVLVLLGAVIAVGILRFVVKTNLTLQDHANRLARLRALQSGSLRGV